MTWIGVDVGGGSVKLGAITADGKRLDEKTLPLPAKPTAAGVLAATGKLIVELAKNSGAELERMGVGLPGLLDRKAGTVLNSPNLPWLENADVRALLAASTGLDAAAIQLENDANVAALGEQWIGAAAGETHVLTVTLGTGIGGGLILGGELYLGAGLAGEIGHVTVDPEGPACGCGSRGCLETLASASATERRARERGLPENAEGDLPELCAVARRAPGPERDLLMSIGIDLGHGLGTALCLLDIRCIVFCGGFSSALDLLEPGIRRGLKEWSYGTRVASVRLVRGHLGQSAGWIGAARLGAR